VLFSSEGQKDSLAFVQETKEFVCSLATLDMLDAVVTTGIAFPRGINEMEQAGIAAAPSRLVRPPRVAASPCALECRVVHRLEIQDVEGRPTDQHITVGQVVGVHIDERYIVDGRVDTVALSPIARCGYRGDYTVVERLFEMLRPG
jgi:flavin reductase (DIM6/NTAB) family NADH-FMN oxidoreductase RutF